MRIWPIEEYLARTVWSPDMVAHLQRENPNGKLEGELPKGITQEQHNEACAKFDATGRPSTYDYDARFQAA